MVEGKKIIVPEQQLKDVVEVKNIHRTFHIQLYNFIKEKGLEEEFFNEYFPEGNDLLKEWNDIVKEYKV